MTATLPSQDSSGLSTRVVWAQVDEGFWAATHQGGFFGSVDRVAGGYVSRDSVGSPVGRYATLALAKDSLTTTQHPVNVRRRRVRERMAIVGATTAGAAAVTLAITAGALATSM